MNTQSIRTLFSVTKKQVSQFVSLPLSARGMVKGIITTAHHTLMLVGIGASIAIVIMFFKPNVAVQLKEISPFSTATAKEPEVTGSNITAAHLSNLMDAPGKSFASTGINNTAAGDEASAKRIRLSIQQQQLVTEWLSKRYRVAGDATNMLVSAAYLTADEIKLDPLLILAVMAIESGFNPFAESPVGAQGLMQVMSKIHRAKFQDLGGVKAALNPVTNIKVGSLILKDYVKRGGSVEAGLKLYVGAAAFETDSGYGAKVLAEYNRLKDVAMGKKIPLFSTNPIKTVQKLPTPEIIDDQKNIPLVIENKSASVASKILPLSKALQVAEL